MIILINDLLTAYWGRDPSGAANAANNQLFGSPFGGGGLGAMMNAAGAAGAGNNYERHAQAAAQAQAQAHHNNTMAVAASQAASLAGLHSSEYKIYN